MSPSLGEFPAIPGSLGSWSLDSDSLISSLFLLREVLAWVNVSVAEVIVDIIWFIDDEDCHWRSFSSFRPFKTSVDWPFAVELTDWFVVVFTVVSLLDFFQETNFPLSIGWVLSRTEVCESRTEKSPVEMSMSNWSTTFVPPLSASVSVMTDCSLFWPCKSQRISPVDFCRNCKDVSFASLL